MGCITCKSKLRIELKNQPCDPNLTSYPVPFGHVPYTPSLPGAMGPLLDFPVDWWYYGGWATDISGTKQFSILMNTTRTVLEQSGATLLYGIGIYSPGSQYHQLITKWAPGSGKFPPATSTSWSTSIKTSGSEQSSMTCTLTSGVLGLPGAMYKLDLDDETNQVHVSLSLKDNFGMILEGASGAYRRGMGDSYEFAMPSLAIQEDSTITIKGVPTQLRSGNIWLDRQSLGISTRPGQQFHAISTPSSHEFYIGNWLAVVMDNQTCYMIAFIWPKLKSKQWIVGTEVHPPVLPTRKIGLEYPALRTWDGQSPIQGVNVLKSSDFDINILKPEDPSQSPHWISPMSGHTYCSAWHLRIREQVYTVTVWIPGSELNQSNNSETQYFYEGAATISDANGCKVGHAFVEQMGYN